MLIVRKKPVTKVTGLRINKTLKNLAIREIIYIYIYIYICVWFFMHTSPPIFGS